MDHSLERGRDESGATLILALIFIIVCSLVLFSLVSLNGNDLVNTGNLRNERTTEYAADGAVNAAIQWTRDLYKWYPGTPFANCMPNGVSSMTIYPTGAPVNPPDAPATPDDVVTVACGNGTDLATPASSNPLLKNPNGRAVSFYACAGTVPVASCGSSVQAVLTAIVWYDDYSSTGYTGGGCSATTTATCGSGMTIESWVVTNTNS